MSLAIKRWEWCWKKIIKQFLLLLNDKKFSADCWAPQVLNGHIIIESIELHTHTIMRSSNICYEKFSLDFQNIHWVVNIGFTAGNIADIYLQA